MKFDIIEQNYIFKHKYFTFFKVIGVLYFYFLLRLTSINSDNSFSKYESEIGIASLSFMILSLILFFVNSFLYSKEGNLTIERESVLILKNGWRKTIDLNKIKSIRIKKLRGKEFVLKLDKFEINLEISPPEFEKLKKIETITKIKFEKVSVFNKLKSSLQIFANKNKAFMEEMNRE
ncbi:hypothetical protein HNV10_16825 [Winogradskyella litoriviva]|uniref:Uncharacterized protein n=1 Tax=Winogradskyella litoriviva TaxID=1220182 RepID=A0ABX2EAA8_9FLAO|nr:hypothetical protein [Winogradskyella litoriviva]NRD24921.1 hypothetical protein [Winogradskyella litoriviva]